MDGHFNLQIKTKAELKNIKLPYGCRYCGKEFARPHEKVKHERVHTGKIRITHWSDDSEFKIDFDVFSFVLNSQ